jgi:hypothetical protein
VRAEWLTLVVRPAELDKDPLDLLIVRRALLSAGIEFIDESGRPVGIRLSRDAYDRP